MGYFSELLAEPAAQQAGRMSLDELLQRNVVGADVWDPLSRQAGLSEWRYTGGGSSESGEPIFSGVADRSLLSKPFEGYTFDWQDTGPANTGTLTAYDPTGNLYGTFKQKDQTAMQGFGEWAALAGAGFGAAGLAGFGPLGGLFGGAGAGADFGAGASVGGVGGEGGAILAGEGAVTGGSGLTLGGGGTYGSITAPAGALGAGGAGLGSGVGITAPVFAGSGTGIAGGLGMTAGTGTAAASTGLGGILSSIGGYLPAAANLASIASGVYGLKLAGDGRHASALSRYSGDFYNQEAQRLASLAGAGQTPGAGQALGADLASQSLGSIGYGIGPLLQRLTAGG